MHAQSFFYLVKPWEMISVSRISLVVCETSDSNISNSLRYISKHSIDSPRLCSTANFILHLKVSGTPPITMANMLSTKMNCIGKSAVAAAVIPTRRAVKKKTVCL